MDLSTSINRMRFDGLAAGVYRQVGSKLTSIVNEAGFDLAQIDEVLLAGSSTLFPGLQSHLSLLVAPTTPVTATIDPSQAIAIGCALQALHLSKVTDVDGLTVDAVLGLTKDKDACLAHPIGFALPGADSKEIVKVIEAGAPLPTRRRIAVPVATGTNKVALEVWEGKDEVKVEKVERPPVEKDDDDEDEDDEEEEDEEIKTPILTKSALVGAVQLELKSAAFLMVEIIIQKDASISVRAWEEGDESNSDSFEA
jgi:molecular chaperone DnaK (HSP70)